MLPIQITIKDIGSSPALKSHIQEKIKKLQQFYNRICRCHVVIELSKKHLHQGKLYNVRIDLNVPGKELVSTYKVNEDIYIAIRDAFDVMERQLENHVRRRQGRVKNHEDMERGLVTQLMPQDGYGFIKGTDGYEYYFSELNVSYPNFKSLEIGDAVNFIAHFVGDGRQAHHITRSRNHH